MRMQIDTVCQRAFEILKDGACHPTVGFSHLVRRKPTDAPWEHTQKITIMLKRLQRFLDAVEHQKKLVRLSKRGERGLYQLIARKNEEFQLWDQTKT